MLYHNTVRHWAALLLGFSLSASSYALNLVVSIAPLHSLVVQVAEPTDSASVLIPSNQSPHDFAMRPSMARDLENADAVFWMGPALETGLVESFSRHPMSVMMTDDHADEAGEHDHAHQHDHGDVHGWLSVKQSQQMLDDIAGSLGRLDPARAERFQDRASAAKQRLSERADEWRAKMVAMSDVAYWVFHDAYQSFEDEYAIKRQAVIQANVNANPSARQISRLRANMMGQPGCAFVEPQLDQRWAKLAVGKLPIEILTLDPLGVSHAPGVDLHQNVLADMVDVFAQCAARIR